MFFQILESVLTIRLFFFSVTSLKQEAVWFLELAPLSI